MSDRIVMSGETAWCGIRRKARSALTAGLLAAALLPAVAATSARADTILSYVFSPDAAIIISGDAHGTFGSNVTESLSGGFTWDATTNSLGSASVTVSGSFMTETFNSPPDLGSANFRVVDLQDGVGDIVEFAVANAFSLGASDPLGNYNVFGSYPHLANADDFATIASLTGSVEPADTPEPASMAVLGAGLAALGMIPRRRAGRRPA